MRHRSDWHKPLMLLATYAIIAPAIARIPAFIPIGVLGVILLLFRRSNMETRNSIVLIAIAAFTSAFPATPVHADDCQPVVDALHKLAVTPVHEYMQKTAACRKALSNDVVVITGTAM